MKDELRWVAAIYCMLGGAIMILFWRKISKAIGSDWWPFYRFLGKDYTEVERVYIKKQQRRAAAYVFGLFIMAAIIGTIIYRSRR